MKHLFIPLMVGIIGFMCIQGMIGGNINSRQHTIFVSVK